jgi:hypothetical protein
MNANWIVTACGIIDAVLAHLEHRSHMLAQVPGGRRGTGAFTQKATADSVRCASAASRS